MNNKSFVNIWMLSFLTRTACWRYLNVNCITNLPYFQNITFRSTSLSKHCIHRFVFRFTTPLQKRTFISPHASWVHRKLSRRVYTTTSQYLPLLPHQPRFFLFPPLRGPLICFPFLGWPALLAQSLMGSDDCFGHVDRGSLARWFPWMLWRGPPMGIEASSAHSSTKWAWCYFHPILPLGPTLELQPYAGKELPSPWEHRKYMFQNKISHLLV